jgi:hypothetical protein
MQLGGRLVEKRKRERGSKNERKNERKKNPEQTAR